jgi:hypothetical protein
MQRSKRVVCCNFFFEERAVELPRDEDEIDHVGLAMIDDLEHERQNGRRLRVCLCSGFRALTMPASTKSATLLERMH